MDMPYDAKKHWRHQAKLQRNLGGTRVLSPRSKRWRTTAWQDDLTLMDLAAEAHDTPEKPPSPFHRIKKGELHALARVGAAYTSRVASINAGMRRHCSRGLSYEHKVTATAAIVIIFFVLGPRI